MDEFEIKGLNAAYLCCHGGRADHTFWFFETYYEEMLKSFIPTFMKRANDITRTSDASELGSNTDTVKDYIVTVAEKMNTLEYPGGGYLPEKIISLPNTRFRFLKIENINRTPGNVINVVCIVPLYYIGDFEVEDKINLIESSNYHVNKLCNNPKYKPIFKELYKLYCSNLRNYENVNYIIPTYSNMVSMYIGDTKYRQKYLNKEIVI